MSSSRLQGLNRLSLRFILIIGLAIFSVLFAGSGRGAVTTPAGVDTNPLNLDPLVRQAFERFYILDYDGALSKIEKVQAQNPTSPLAVDYVLDTVIFRELYRLDLLDTTLYAHDGFLNGKHTVAPDHAVADQVNSLFNKAMDLSGQQLSEEFGGCRTRCLRAAGRVACTRFTSAWSTGASFPRFMSLCKAAATTRRYCGWILSILTPS